jgi:hypothetical protein
VSALVGAAEAVGELGLVVENLVDLGDDGGVRLELLVHVERLDVLLELFGLGRAQLGVSENVLVVLCSLGREMGVRDDCCLMASSRQSFSEL